jgi:AAA+ ATPase superfamily predicted ATPase
VTQRRFLNRTEELAALQRRWDNDEAQIFTLWGRRRVGKTLLLLEFARDKRCLYFEATSGTKNDQLNDFSDRLADATGRAALRVPDWKEGLDAVADWAQEGPVLLVLDEFQFLAKQNAGIGSIINVWWRERGEQLPIMLILSGSEVGFFEREVVNYSATTYGRRAGQLRLRPFKARDVGLFLPTWSAEDKIGAYAIFGHMPYYLSQVRSDESIAENILNIVLMPDGLLHEEARLLLDQELPETGAYFSVLRALAAGDTRIVEIANRTGISAARVNQMLDQLRSLWLVDKQFPVTVSNPERSKQSFYRITDPYLRFWFRFVLPAQGRLADAEGARRHLAGRVLPQLDEFVSAPAFEEICQQWLLRDTDAASVGWWWGRVRETHGPRKRDVEHEIDTVAVDDSGKVTALGSCKWTAGKLPYSEKTKLDVRAGHLVPDGPPPDLYFFARNGVDDALQQEANANSRLHVVTTSELLS